MNTSTWIAIYLPLIVLFLIIIPQQRQRQKSIILRNRKRRDVIIMTNEMIKKYIGMDCKISTGSFGTYTAGKIADINENWVEVETKKGKELINADFIQSIKLY